MLLQMNSYGSSDAMPLVWLADLSDPYGVGCHDGCGETHCMTRTHSSARGLAVCLAVLVVAACGSGAPGGSSEANELREIERERLRALVDADVEAADRLHSEDLQLVTPTGLALTRTSISTVSALVSRTMLAGKPATSRSSLPVTLLYFDIAMSGSTSMLVGNRSIEVRCTTRTSTSVARGSGRPSGRRHPE